MSGNDDMIIEDQMEDQPTKEDRLTVNLPPAQTQEKTYANVASTLPPEEPSDQAHPPGPSNASDHAQGLPADQPFHVLDRSELWTTTETPQQVQLNNDATTTLHFPRYLDVNAHDVINSLNDLGFDHPVVKAVRRVAPGIFAITFDTRQNKQRFQTHFGFTVKGHAPLIREARIPPVFVSIRNASPELPDAAVIARLRCFGDVLSFRRCLHRDTNIENGFRTARMRVRTTIPSFIRLASETLHIVYDGQPRTCKRCHRVGHEGRDCNLHACFNCDEIGHVASACVHPSACSICKSIAHKAYACSYAIIDDLARNTSIAESLAAALTAVPVVPSAPTTVASQTQDEEASLTEAADLVAENSTRTEPITATDPRPEIVTDGHHSSSHTGDTAILSTAGLSATLSTSQLPATEARSEILPTARATKESAKSTAKQPLASSQMPVFKKPDAPAPRSKSKTQGVFVFGSSLPTGASKNTRSGPKGKNTLQRLKRITSPMKVLSPSSQDPAKESSQDFSDNVSVASSKRKVSSRSSSPEDPGPFVRRRTCPAVPHHGQKKGK